MSTSYLSKKSWHVWNYDNQKKVMEAMEQEKEKRRKEEQKKKEIEEQRQELASIRAQYGDDVAARVASEMQTSFMYEVPPGYTLKVSDEKERTETKPRKRDDVKKQSREALRKAKADPMSHFSKSCIEEEL